MLFDRDDDDDDDTVATAKSFDEASHSFNAVPRKPTLPISTGQLLWTVRTILMTKHTLTSLTQ